MRANQTCGVPLACKTIDIGLEYGLHTVVVLCNVVEYGFAAACVTHGSSQTIDVFGYKLVGNRFGMVGLIVEFNGNNVGVGFILITGVFVGVIHERFEVDLLRMNGGRVGSAVAFPHLIGKSGKQLIVGLRPTVAPE